MDTHLLGGTLDLGLYCVGALRLRQGRPDAVPLSLSTLLSPSGTESRQQEGDGKRPHLDQMLRLPLDPMVGIPLKPMLVIPQELMEFIPEKIPLNRREVNGLDVPC